MKELLLKGFVTPADCGGDLQKAIDTAKELKLGKVVVEQDIIAPNVHIPGDMFLVIQNATITGNLMVDGGENWSFSKKWINIEGENAAILGNITFFNATNVTIAGLQLKGELICEYVNWLRIIDVQDGLVTIGRGCTNVIIQKRTNLLAITGKYSCGKIVPGSKPDITNVVVQDCTCEVDLTAAADCGLLNVQVQNLQGEVILGEVENQLPPEQFMNLSFINISGGIEELNPTKHTYVK